MEQQAQSKRFMDKFLDVIDEIDRYLYGRKMKNFLIGALLVLVIAPLLDEVLEVPFDRLTWLATLAFFLYVTVIVLAWVSAWRDENGRWTRRRAISKLKMYYHIFRDAAASTRTTSTSEIFYRAGGILFFGAIGWKSMQNLSVFIRKPIQFITGHTMTKFIRFEKFTHHWYWLPMIMGIGIIIYLVRSNPQILQRIKRDLLQLFGRTQMHNPAVNIKMNDNFLVINTRHDEHLNSITVQNTSRLFAEFVSAMKCWNPGRCYYEYEFQDKLCEHLRKKLPNSVVETERPIGDKALGNKGRADIVIDETILIEMKRKQSGSGEADRARGQIHRYSEIWSNRGPVILLLCGHEYEHARITFTPIMEDFVKLDRPVLAMVHEN